MNLTSFVDNIRKSLNERREDSLGLLIEAMDELYQVAPEKSPFPHSTAGNEPTDLYGKCLFVCHKAFLSAAVSTQCSFPDDGEAITRRALEAAKTCVAIKANPDNYAEWFNAERRLARWQLRGSGQVPKPLQLKFEDLKNLLIYNELMAEIGAVSDFAVHFTPEYFGRYTWEESKRVDGGSDFSFGLWPGAIELGFLMLCKHHEVIIRAFDYCQDGNMLKHPAVALALDKAGYLQNRFAELLKPTIDAIIGEQNDGK